MPIASYRWLMAGGTAGDPFDRHLFACAVALALADSARPLAVGLGLSAECLAALVGRYFPHAPGLLAGLSPDEDGAEPRTPEEGALRSLLLDHRAEDTVETDWLAHIIARRATLPHHLWQDLGLSGHADLGLLMHRHFAPLAARNRRDMRWKAFFHQELGGAPPLACSEIGDGRSLLVPACRQSDNAIPAQPTN